MSSMHSVNQRENKKAPALSAVTRACLSSTQLRAVTYRSGSSCSNSADSSLIIATRCEHRGETPIAAEAAAATNVAISAPNGSRPTARTLVGQRACAARRRDATDGPDGRVASEAGLSNLYKGTVPYCGKSVKTIMVHAMIMHASSQLHCIHVCQTSTGSG